MQNKTKNFLRVLCLALLVNTCAPIYAVWETVGYVLCAAGLVCCCPCYNKKTDECEKPLLMKLCEERGTIRAAVWQDGRIVGETRIRCSTTPPHPIAMLTLPRELTSIASGSPVDKDKLPTYDEATNSEIEYM